MKKSDFYFDLPESYIAKKPSTPRDHAKLMVIDRKKQSISHHVFYELPKLLPEKTCLVRNDSKVLKARVLGTLPTGGHVELFFLQVQGSRKADFLVKPARKFAEGASVTIHIGTTHIHVHVTKAGEFGLRELSFPSLDTDIYTFLETYGTIPLPPYINETNPAQWEERYQTIYADKLGSVAAPTAGLHFTPEVDAALHSKGILTEHVTLHVGAGTFLPVKTDDIAEHVMHKESYSITKETVQALCAWKKNGGSICAVGTTTTRTLEDAWKRLPNICATTEDIHHETDIFITPPYTFQCIDTLITNFHLPESTLLMLVSAFIGDIAFTLHAYEIAKEQNYRFYSFGDAMLIL